MKQLRKINKSLIRPILNGMVILVLVLVSGVEAIGFYVFTDVLQDQYAHLTDGIAQYVAMRVDVASLGRYLETEARDEAYEEFRLSIQGILEAEECRAIYVAKVDLEARERVYIYDVADNPEDAAIYTIGYRYPLKETYLQIYNRILQGESDYRNCMYTGKDPVSGSYTHSIAPVRDESGNVVAVAGVVKGMNQLDDAKYAFVKQTTIFALVLAVFTGFGWILYMRQSIVLPIQKLNRAAESMVEHLADGTAPEIQVKKDNEVKRLAESFTAMYAEIGAYITKLSAVTAEKERIGAELDVAARIQTSMLPCIFPPFPNRTEFDIYATMDPAKEVGGDFYDFFMVDEDHLAFVVADVSGKGIPAALFMVIGKTLIKDHTGLHADLGDVFTEVNNILCASNSEEMFITAFEGVLNLKTGELRYVNAGHEVPFLCRKGGIYEPFKVKSGFVLAGMEGIRYKGGSIRLEPGDKLFQYSDGVPDAINRDTQAYGLDRLARILAKNSDRVPSELLPVVKADVDAFVGETAQFDDITMLGLIYNGPQQD